MLTPNQYIESVYANQGFKVVCQSVEAELEYCAVSGRNLEGKFRLVNCTNPKAMLTVEGLQFLNFYMQHIEVCSVDGSKERIPTGEVDFFFFCRSGSEVAEDLLQSFAAQFSKGG